MLRGKAGHDHKPLAEEDKKALAEQALANKQQRMFKGKSQKPRSVKRESLAAEAGSHLD